MHSEGLRRRNARRAAPAKCQRISTPYQKNKVDSFRREGQNVRHEITSGWGGSLNDSEGTGVTMDAQARNEFEHLCALAEIEEDPDKFIEIRRDIIRVLDEKQAFLNRQRPASRVRFPSGSSNVA
jgi:hypothetical protein